MFTSTILGDFPFNSKAESNPEAAAYTLYSNHVITHVAIPSLGHGSGTPFRKFELKVEGGKIIRVFCGYSEGRGHPGDEYNKRTFPATTFTTCKLKNGKFVRNGQGVSRALIYFYDVLQRQGEPSKFEQMLIQTYVWACSMGKNPNSCCEELRSNLHASRDVMNRVIAGINSQRLCGTVHVYDCTKCKKNKDFNIHQCYFYWERPNPKTGNIYTSRSADRERNVKISVKKLDSKTNKPLPNAEFTLQSHNFDGKAITAHIKTNSNGIAEYTYHRYLKKSVTSPNFNYVTNYNDLSNYQQNYYKTNNYYRSRQAAFNAAKAWADKEAERQIKLIWDAAEFPWIVTEVKTPGYYIVNGANVKTSIERKGVKNLSFEFKNEPQLGSIKVVKDAGTTEYPASYSLAGAKFLVTGPDNFRKTVTTNTSGVATLSDLRCGTYTITETVAPKGFVKNTSTKTITISPNTQNPTVKTLPQQTATFAEPPETGSVAITKSLDTVGNPEPNVRFRLTGKIQLKNGSYYSKEGTTNGSGYLKFDNVPYGTYTLTQVNAPNNTIKLPDKVFTIDANNKNQTFSGAKALNRTIVQGEIHLFKVKQKVRGNGENMNAVDTFDEASAQFEIYAKQDIKNPATDQIAYRSDQVVETITTNNDGYAKSTRVLYPGKYSLKQISGTTGFKMLEGEHNFTIVQNQTEEVKFHFTNNFDGCYVKLYKEKRNLDSLGNYEEEGIPESDAQFVLLDASKIRGSGYANYKKWTEQERRQYVNDHSDAIIYPIETDENGVVRTASSYYLTTDDSGIASAEIPAEYKTEQFIIMQIVGEEGYYMSNPIKSSPNNSQKKDWGQFYSFNCENKEIKYYAYAKITKMMETKDGTKPEANSVFQLLDKDGNVFSYKNPVTHETVNKFKTDKNGVMYIPYLYQNSYTLKQISGPASHKEPSGDDVEIAVSKEECVITEEDMNDFVITNFDESVLSEASKQAMIDSDFVREITDEAYPVMVKFEKRSTYTNTLLNRAVFEIYKKSKNEDGTVKLDLVTTIQTGKSYSPNTSSTTGDETSSGDETTLQDDDDLDPAYTGKTDCILPYGDYVVRETVAPSGYLLSEKDTGIDSKDENFVLQEQEFTIDQEYAKQLQDGTLVYVNSPEDANTGTSIVFKDSPIMGKISVNKLGEIVTSFDTGDKIEHFKNSNFSLSTKKLAGAKFNLIAGEVIKNDKGDIIHNEGDIIDTATTDENGNISFTRVNTEDPDESGPRTDKFFMGKYIIQEIEAPEGYILDPEPHEILLTDKAGADKINDIIGGNIADPEDLGEAYYDDPYYLEQGKPFNQDIKSLSSSIENIYFTHIVHPNGAETIDVSQAKDGSIVAWADGSTIYVSSQKNNQDIYFNIDCSNMFYGLSDVKNIVFNNVNTSAMSYAEKMFANCYDLEVLDLSNFLTGNLTNTIQMFANCGKLKTIYIGDTDQHNTTTDDNSVTLVCFPKDNVYFYFNPNDENATDEEREALKFAADNFTFLHRASDGTLEELPVTDEDIKSITPAYPYFPDDLTKKSGKLEITIVLKADSEYAVDNQDTPLKVTVNVIDPSTLNWDPETVEHPEAELKSTNQLYNYEFAVRKVSADNTEHDLGDAEFSVYAATTLVNDEGTVIANEGDLLFKGSTLDPEVDDGGYLGFTYLPTRVYAQNKNAPYLYTIKETKAPDGFLPPENFAYVPNINFGDIPADNDASAQEAFKSRLESLAENGANDISVEYLTENTRSSGKFNFQFTFVNPTRPTIKKDWQDVPEEHRPESLTVHAYSDRAKTQLVKTFVLKKEDDWKAYWDDMPNEEIGSYYWSEDIPEGYKWIQDPDNPIRVYPSDDPDKPNTLIFYNKSTEGVNTKAKVQKTWKDHNNEEGLRPDSVYVSLYQNGQPYSDYQNVELNEDNHWYFETGEIPKYDNLGQPYEYKWMEDEDADSPNRLFLAENAFDGYIHSERLDTETNTTHVTNTHKVATRLTINKIWDDNNDSDGIRPEKVYVNLLRNGQIVDEYKNVEIKASDEWTFTTGDLEKYDENDQPYEYTWEEVKTPGSFNIRFLTGNVFTGYVDSVSTTGETTEITNRHSETTDSLVKKVWDDYNNHFNTRPVEIHVSLYADDLKLTNFTIEEIDKTSGKKSTREITDGNVVLTENNLWKVKALNLPKYNNENEPIFYTWKEEETLEDYSEPDIITSYKEN